jgi:DNA-binding MarR family transcriptional regulator
MDHQDLRTLQILEEVGNDPVPSQRDLAKKLNVSLGLVNSFVKRLVQKGYFKITTFPRNRVKYILTPKGAMEKTRLTYAYIHHSYQFYKNARKKLRELFEGLTQAGVRRVVFYGATDLAEIAFVSLQETSLELAAIVDDQRIGNEFLRQTVLAPEELEKISFDRVLITALRERERVVEQLERMGISGKKIASFE